MIRAIAALAFLATVQVCTAQDSGWMPGQGIPGVMGNVYAVTSWDPDGEEGPSPELLVIGGEFTQAGDTLARNIVMWDGERWRTFGNTPEGRVNALAVFNNTLYAAGTFPGEVARWDGREWKTLPGHINGFVECLLATQDRLYIGGSFQTSDFMPVKNVASWDGDAWTPLGVGVEFNVWTMEVHDGVVFAGGGVGPSRESTGGGRVSRWTGQTWEPIEASVLSRAVLSMEVWGGDLYASLYGVAYLPGGATQSVFRWNGTSWIALQVSAQSVSLLLDTPHGLLAAGANARAMLPNGTWSNGVNVWDGAAWSSRPGFQPDVQNLSEMPGCLWNDTIVLGQAGYSQNGACSRSVQTWTGSAWWYVGDALCAEDMRLSLLNDTIVATTMWTHDGNESLRSPMYRDGVNWHSIAPDCQTNPQAKPVEHNGELYFSTSRETPPLGSHVHAWNGESLRVVAPEHASPIAFYQGVLHGAIHDGTAYAVKKWNGSAWTTLPGQTPSPSGTPVEIRVFGESLLVFMRTSQSVTVKRWDGAIWTQMGQPLQPTFNAVLVANDTVYVSTSGGQGAASFSRWNGTAWEAAGYPSGTVTAVVEYQGQLIASCRSASGIIPQSWGLYRVTDGVWPAWEGTRPTSVTSMVVRRGELTVTGEPYAVDGVLHTRIARWGDGFPLIQHEPTDTAACLGRTTTLEVDVSGTARLGVSYEWSKDGLPLINGLTPPGSRLWGTNEFRLLIGNTTSTDAGVYTCRITTDRGEAQTTPATVTVGWQGCCEPDFNCDSALDAADLACLESAVGGDDSCSCGRDPDFNRDLSLDGFDIEALSGVLNGGACP